MTEEDERIFAAYRKALAQHGAEPIVLSTHVGTLGMLVAVLQLALRHPLMEDENIPTVQVVRAFVDTIRTRLVEIDPAFGALIGRGQETSGLAGWPLDG